ncbi:polymerase delta-interacting protein 2-like [Homalodisca vitripennis]|uniref:polymerase delta-interacting protein 2-like n=1 Tax=Homalodisca vitripennis TaxID=197043 RepID=UPI001EEBBE14|nr:polymerase delta-interacting protein 2-like [Homalodisca vitripennis]
MLSSNLLLKCRSKILLRPCVYLVNQTALSSQLIEIGHLEKPKTTSNYETGQLFLHKVWGYRGIILFPWVARIFDRDLKDCSEEIKYNLTFLGGREVKCSTENYYQVLIDCRDRPYIRAQTEAVTFMGCASSSYRLLQSVPGLDYTAHRDILPYTATEKLPLKHEMFDSFFLYKPNKDPNIEAKDSLKVWKNNNVSWLRISDVHKETTEEVRITAIPFFMGCRRMPETTLYSWRYCIRLENLSDMSLHFKSHTWRIFSMSGLTETVKGKGVMGQELSLDKYSPSFQYCGHVNLSTPYGHMSGSFQVNREDGSSFDCLVPLFLLETKINQDDTLF